MQKLNDMRYPDMNIQAIHPEEGSTAGDMPHGLGLRTEISVTLVKSEIEGWRVNRYPWHLLESMDAYMVIKNCKATTARLMAYLYAKRRGWKISTSVKGPTVAWLWRVE